MSRHRLSRHSLPDLAPGVQAPPQMTQPPVAGLVHCGVGGFHRAHQARVIDDLMAQGLADRWAIVGVGVREQDKAMTEALGPQDWLYSLTTKDMTHSHTRVIGSIIDILYAPDDPGAVLELLTQESIAIVSLTITEGGYNVDQMTGDFVWSQPEILADLDRLEAPATIFGFLTEALRRRRSAGIAPFTVMSCDNIQGNGHLAKRMVVAFASRVDPELAHWINAEVAFPNSMVDRITPVTTPEAVVEAGETLGLDDAWPVVAETFFQWVLEDNFPAGRPPFEKAGVQMVADVEPYELMKLRLLNASHQALAYFGFLLGYRCVHDAVNDNDIETLLRRYMADEAQATLRPVPGVDMAEYQNTLITRFTNAQVNDTIARLCAESSDRIPKWLVPVITERLDQGLDVSLSAAVVASWARYAEGVDESGDPIPVVDNLKSDVMARASLNRTDPLAFVRNTALFGDLADREGFTTPYTRTLSSLHTKGARETLTELLSQTT